MSAATKSRSNNDGRFDTALQHGVFGALLFRQRHVNQQQLFQFHDVWSELLVASSQNTINAYIKIADIYPLGACAAELSRLQWVAGIGGRCRVKSNTERAQLLLLAISCVLN